jgi:XTP/dITP diphosphohydrolase
VLTKLLLASSNPGKLREYQALTAGRTVGVELLPRYDNLPGFNESAPTFAENAAGKALHYSRHADGIVLADDSGLVVDALDGAPGVHSARYAGAGASDADRVQKLLREMKSCGASNRSARFICVIALAQAGRALAIVSDSVKGALLEEPRGTQGFGYDPIFYFPPLRKGFAELTREEKNEHSHRGKAFCKLLAWLEKSPVTAGES